MGGWKESGRCAYTQRKDGGDVGVWREEGELDFQLRKLGGLGSYS